MIALAFVILAAIALAACGFVALPILRSRDTRGRYVLAAAAVLFVLGVGGGLYLFLGQPQLAVRTLEGSQARDLNALIGRLGVAVREHPDNPRGWALLGQAYLTAHDPADASKAFARGIDAAKVTGMPATLFYSAYGEALTQASAGAVTPEAEAAFTQALALDPQDQAARYYLGLAEAARGNNAKALAMWKTLLADLPANSPARADLVDRIAALTAKGAGGPPDIGAMVAGLAARLKDQPNDPDGWLRLVRAYSVLGDKAKAEAALSDARKAMRARGDVLAALDTEQKELGL
ncbi:MAG: tetratricopeptide repeat protein [Alphaproteobacteria bacterium]|nr:tetratricopeptide repeat protein [Alphaproteobacteria bacterium]MBL6939959.1 tetratricopeptide repeat protein [Alphaproteobacteria bacterium]MBL7098185.1 tetratricopeptide repeat protein [Alphaproteobacteria bacterium]